MPVVSQQLYHVESRPWDTLRRRTRCDLRDHVGYLLVCQQASCGKVYELAIYAWRNLQVLAFRNSGWSSAVLGLV